MFKWRKKNTAVLIFLIFASSFLLLCLASLSLSLSLYSRGFIGINVAHNNIAKASGHSNTKHIQFIWRIIIGLA